MANERTFLAWIRTALALLASAIVLNQIFVLQPEKVYTSYLAIFSAIAAAMMSPMAFHQWRANEIAMRNDRALPPSRIIYFVLFYCTVATTIVVVIFVKHI